MDKLLHQLIWMYIFYLSTVYVVWRMFSIKSRVSHPEFTETFMETAKLYHKERIQSNTSKIDQPCPQHSGHIESHRTTAFQQFHLGLPGNLTPHLPNAIYVYMLVDLKLQYVYIYIYIYIFFFNVYSIPIVYRTIPKAFLCFFRTLFRWPCWDVFRGSHSKPHQV